MSVSAYSPFSGIVPVASGSTQLTAAALDPNARGVEDSAAPDVEVMAQATRKQAAKAERERSASQWLAPEAPAQVALHPPQATLADPQAHSASVARTEGKVRIEP